MHSLPLNKGFLESHMFTGVLMAVIVLFNSAKVALSNSTYFLEAFRAYTFETKGGVKQVKFFRL